MTVLNRLPTTLASAHHRGGRKKRWFSLFLASGLQRALLAAGLTGLIWSLVLSVLS